ncbi:MAG: hypothetical protein QE164_02535 [Candidatus Nezhaarchaeota archaeon]|nr:hypothetical protein [Candidatus Nezhaarchaeota archaeon]
MKENDELRGRLKVSLKELLRGAEEERRRILHEVESLKRERENQGWEGPPRVRDEMHPQTATDEKRPSSSP